MKKDFTIYTQKHRIMETYTHFGKQPDVFKHLALCEILQIESPHTYIDTNSACAIYTLNRTPEQDYGIYHFLNSAKNIRILNESLYYNLEKENVAINKYLGSPALAMNLNKTIKKYLFFDLDNSSLDNIKDYASNIGLLQSIRLFNVDSIEGTLQILSELHNNTFLHIDPYEINKCNSNGHTYIDVLVKATQKGMKCLLWYGFWTIDEKEKLNKYIEDKFKEKGQKCLCYELIMNEIKKDSIVCNPGIIGSGLITTNLSLKSNNIINEYLNILVDIYKNTHYKQFNGSLYKDIFIIE